MVEATAAVVRALSLIALFQAAGGAVFLRLFDRQLFAAHAAIRRGVLAALAAAAALMLLHFALEPARMAGEFSGVWDGALQQLAWRSGMGLGLRLRLFGLLLLLCSLWSGEPCQNGRVGRGRVATLLCAAGIALVVGAFTTLGHTVHHPHRGVLAALLVLHLLGVCYWFGALWPLRQMLSAQSAAQAGAVLQRFSRIALWLVPALFLAGAGLVWNLVPGLRVFAHPYGQLLLAKVVGFSVLMGLAALNKLRLTPALSRNDPAAEPRLRKSLQLEYGIIAVVLTVTAVMTNQYSPD